MATRQISETLVDIQKYPRTMKRRYDNRDAISPIFKFSKDVRMVIYTINAIESLNSTYRQLNSQRSVIIIHILYIYMRYRPLKYSRSSTQNCMDFQIHYIF